MLCSGSRAAAAPSGSSAVGTASRGKGCFNSPGVFHGIALSSAKSHFKMVGKIFSEGRRSSICSDILNPLQIFFSLQSDFKYIIVMFKKHTKALISNTNCCLLSSPLLNFVLHTKLYPWLCLHLSIFGAQRSTFLTRPADAAGLVLLFLE